MHRRCVHRRKRRAACDGRRWRRSRGRGCQRSCCWRGRQEQVETHGTTGVLHRPPVHGGDGVHTRGTVLGACSAMRRRAGVACATILCPHGRGGSPRVAHGRRGGACRQELGQLLSQQCSLVDEGRPAVELQHLEVSRERRDVDRPLMCGEESGVVADTATPRTDRTADAGAPALGAIGAERTLR